MSYETEANEIARMLRQKRLKKNPYVGDVVRIDVLYDDEYLTTKEAAKALNRSCQTLRIWACKGSGPISPVHLGTRTLGWKVADVQSILNGVGLGA